MDEPLDVRALYFYRISYSDPCAWYQVFLVPMDSCVPSASVFQVPLMSLVSHGASGVPVAFGIPGASGVSGVSGAPAAWCMSGASCIPCASVSVSSFGVQDGIII